MTIYDKSTFFVINTVIYEMKRITFKKKLVFFIYFYHTSIFKKVLRYIFLYEKFFQIHKKGRLNENLIAFPLKLQL